METGLEEDYEALVQFLYMAPIGLLQARLVSGVDRGTPPTTVTTNATGTRVVAGVHSGNLYTFSTRTSMGTAGSVSGEIVFQGPARLLIGVLRQSVVAGDGGPYTDTPQEIVDVAGAVRDRNFRIQVAENGVHIYNRDGHQVATDPFDLYPKLGVEDDAGHAFYLGVELARAQIAYQLGKRYAQDEELEWGAAVDAKPVDLQVHRAPGSTTKKKPKKPADRLADAQQGSMPDGTQDPDQDRIQDTP